MKTLAILTDLDGTLLGPDYNLRDLAPLLHHLNDLGVPVIPVTSKTLGELLELSRQAPFGMLEGGVIYVAELGGAIYASKGLLSTSIIPTPTGLGDLYEYPLAHPLDRIRRLIDEALREAGCGEKVLVVSREEPQALSRELGLPPTQARWARERKYDEVLIPETLDCARRLARTASRKGLDVVRGGRHVHVGKGIGKDRAVEALEHSLRHVTRIPLTSQSLCLGDSPIDWRFLEKCRDKAVIPRRKPSRQSTSLRAQYYMAPYPAPRGWAWVVERHVLARSPA